MPQTGLRTGRRISHVFVLDVPRYPKPLLITDAAINVAPDFDAKVDIVRNAIDLAHALGMPQPKVAILSAVETVTRSCARRWRPQPCPRWPTAARSPGRWSMARWRSTTRSRWPQPPPRASSRRVAGDADILVAHDLESANMAGQAARVPGGCPGRRLVMGAKVPIVLTSRANSAHSRIASCALALLWLRQQTGLQS